MTSDKEALMEQLALKLFEINAFKFGNYKMKSGINSPVYFDLRVIVSYPEVMELVSKLLVAYIKELKLNACHVCGVPYTALPLATLVSVDQGIPMLIRRKEAKAYGTKKLIEGIYNAGDTCLIIEDVVTSGSSVLETVRDLKSAGIVVTDAVVMVNREQGAVQNVAKHSVRVHSLFTLSFLLNKLLERGKIDSETVLSVTQYIASSQIEINGSIVDKKNENNVLRTKIKFEKRAEFAKCSIAKNLFNLMACKKTNLCLAADLTKCEEILCVADQCGPFICLLKTHIDIIEDFNEKFIEDLTALAKKHNFLIMEDRKYADIGNTVSMQYGKGIFRISAWADFVTAHALPGRSILKGLKSGITEKDTSKNRGVFLLAEMSAHGNLIDKNYKEATSKIATEGDDVDFVAGVVCQSIDCFAFPGLVQLTPGVKIDESSDQLGQQYETPEYIVKHKGADIGVVGRGILQAKSIKVAAALYRDRLWEAYLDRISN